MIVKIISCSKDSYWYSNHIGEVFEVIDQYFDDIYSYFRVQCDHQPTSCIGYIRSSDCIQLNFEKYNTLTSIVNHLEQCGYVTEDALELLERDPAFLSLKEMAKVERV